MRFQEQDSFLFPVTIKTMLIIMMMTLMFLSEKREMENVEMKIEV